MNRLLLLLLLRVVWFLLLTGSGFGLRINHFHVPEAVERGRSAILHCDYSLENDEELYSIKFYKDNVEFYRFVPQEKLQKQSYILDGVFVNLTASNSTHAFLSKTNLKSDGLYICEISTEGPTFSTVQSEQLMKVYALPEQSVQIHGVLDQYNFGDNISLTCKSGRSWPEVKLQWYLNNALVESKYTLKLPSEKFHSGLVSSHIALNIHAKPHLFKKGIIEIKCVASLSVVLKYQTVERLVTGSFKNKSNNRVPSWRKELQPNQKTPVISGMKKNYLLNEILKLNCSTGIQNAKLKWFIMDREANESNLIRYDFNSHNSRTLGLWLRMEKQLIQMPELRLCCLSYFSKQITQFYSKLQIRTYDNQIWESQSSAIESGVHNRIAFDKLLLILISLHLALFF